MLNQIEVLESEINLWQENFFSNPSNPSNSFEDISAKILELTRIYHQQNEISKSEKMLDAFIDFLPAKNNSQIKLLKIQKATVFFLQNKIEKSLALFSELAGDSIRFAQVISLKDKRYEDLAQSEVFRKASYVNFFAFELRKSEFLICKSLSLAASGESEIKRLQMQAFLCWVYIFQNKKDSAKKLAEKILFLDKKMNNKEKMRVYHNICLVFVFTDDMKKATYLLKSASRISRESGDLLYQYSLFSTFLWLFLFQEKYSEMDSLYSEYQSFQTLHPQIQVGRDIIEGVYLLSILARPSINDPEPANTHFSNLQKDSFYRSRFFKLIENIYFAKQIAGKNAQRHEKVHQLLLKSLEYIALSNLVLFTDLIEVGIEQLWENSTDEQKKEMKAPQRSNFNKAMVRLAEKIWK